MILPNIPIDELDIISNSLSSDDSISEISFMYSDSIISFDSIVFNNWYSSVKRRYHKMIMIYRIYYYFKKLLYRIK